MYEVLSLVFIMLSIINFLSPTLWQTRKYADFHVSCEKLRTLTSQVARSSEAKNKLFLLGRNNSNFLTFYGKKNCVFKVFKYRKIHYKKAKIFIFNISFEEKMLKVGARLHPIKTSEWSTMIVRYGRAGKNFSFA